LFGKLKDCTSSFVTIRKDESVKSKKQDACVINRTEVGGEVINFLDGVSAKEFVDILVKNGVIDVEEEALDYGLIVLDQAVNAVAYVLAAMARKLSPAILKEFNVVEGKYNGIDHVWLMMKDFSIAIDPTLAQFETEVPKISIIDLSQSSAYEWVDENVIDAGYWLSNTSGIDINVALGIKDEKSVGDVEGASEDKRAKKVFKYTIGDGDYSFEEEPTPLDIFLCVLEEYELNIEKEAEGMAPIDYQSLVKGLDDAIKHTASLLDKKFLKKQGTGPL